MKGALYPPPSPIIAAKRRFLSIWLTRSPFRAPSHKGDATVSNDASTASSISLSLQDFAAPRRPRHRFRISRRCHDLAPTDVNSVWLLSSAFLRGIIPAQGRKHDLPGSEWRPPRNESTASNDSRAKIAQRRRQGATRWIKRRRRSGRATDCQTAAPPALPMGMKRCHRPSQAPAATVLQLSS